MSAFFAGAEPPFQPRAAAPGVRVPHAGAAGVTGDRTAAASGAVVGVPPAGGTVVTGDRAAAVGGGAAAGAAGAAIDGLVPTVAVLADPRHGQLVACAVALALADACRQPCGVAAAVGRGAVAPLPLGANARRCSAELRARGYDATAVGRLVWLADLRATPREPDAAREPDPARGAADPAGDGPAPAGAGPSPAATAADDPIAADPAAAVAAASVELHGAARALAAPAALAIPFARSAALDRVLGWHDAIVVVEDGRATTPELARLVLDSLAALDRPVAAMTLPSRLHAAPATAGLRAPAAAAAAVAALGLTASA